MESFRPPSPNSSVNLEEFLFNLIKDPQDIKRREFLFNLKKDPQDIKNREEIFILANAHFVFDWDKNIFVINKLVELKEIYNKRGFVDQNFSEYTKNVLKSVNKRVEKISNKTKLLDKIAIHRAKDSTQNFCVEQYYHSSPLRNTVADYTLPKFVDRMVKAMLIDEIVRKIIFEARLDQSSYQPLQPKFSQSMGSSIFARDYSVALGDNIFQPHHILSESDTLLADPETFFERRKSFFADICSTEENPKINRELPFILEGGNVIACEDVGGRKILLVVISDANIIDENTADAQIEDEKRFFCASVLKDGKVCEVLEESQLQKEIESFGKSQGYNVIMIDRDLKNHPLSSIYHADTFCNVAKLYSSNGVRTILFIPEKSEKVITKETDDKLIEYFGQENIVRFKFKENKLFTNFIQFGNLLVMSNEVNQDLITQLNKIGFSVAIPPISLDLIGGELGDGIRCHTFPRSPTAKPLFAETKSQKIPAATS